MVIKTPVISALVAALALGGCAQSASNTLGTDCKTTATAEGALIGTGAGLILGTVTGMSALGTGLTTAGGAVVGGVLGHAFSTLMGCDEQQAATKATAAAMAGPTGQPVSWQTANASGTVTTTSPTVTTAQGQSCRHVVYTTTTSRDGRTATSEQDLCQAGGGAAPTR